VAFRFIAGNEHPDHDTIAACRKRFLPQTEALFVEVLKLARTMGMLKLGTVALDGTKVHANASRHSALSCGHAKKIEKQLKREVQQLLWLAEQADGVNIPDGMLIPEELERRELRLAAIAAAKAKLESRADERLEREQADHQSKLAARAEQERTGKKTRGPPPAPPTRPTPAARLRLRLAPDAPGSAQSRPALRCWRSPSTARRNRRSGRSGSRTPASGAAPSS
jgi:hypothetical protein